MCLENKGDSPFFSGSFWFFGVFVVKDYYFHHVNYHRLYFTIENFLSVYYFLVIQTKRLKIRCSVSNSSDFFGSNYKLYFSQENNYSYMY